jgi:penicillin-binding protein 2
MTRNLPSKRHWLLAGLILALLLGGALFFRKTPAGTARPEPAASTSGEQASGEWRDRHGAPLNLESATLQALLAALPQDHPAGPLTLDPAWQEGAERLLAEWGKGGAVVVMDPRTGDLLALAGSSEDGVAGIAQALDATQPGAAFLPVTLLAGLSQGLRDFQYECTGATEINGQTWNCWKRDGHGTLGVTASLGASCNCFFYHYGIVAGPEALKTTADVLGLGRKNGLGLAGEQEGIVPSREWLAKFSKGHEKTWRDGHSANIAIGQGALNVTPLQMAGISAVLANGGVVHPPRLFQEAPVQGPKMTLGDLGIQPADLELIRQGMLDSTWKGGDLQIAGRTGSVQTFWKPNSGGQPNVRAWFTGFAPYDQPEVAVTVLLYDGKSGGHSAKPQAIQLIGTVPGRSHYGER